MITPQTAPRFVIDALFDAFDELTDYRIVFTFRGAKLSWRELKNHIKLVDWSPQFDILAHPKTKLFISHGGLKRFKILKNNELNLEYNLKKNFSLKEGICSGTPLAIMPIFAEQARNAKVSASLGIASILNKYKITKENCLAAILKVCF